MNTLHKKNFPLNLALLITIVLMPLILKSQQYNTIYWMQGIPQSAYSNPAHQLDARIYIGVPGASSIYAGFGNTGFTPTDFLRKDNAGDFYWDEDNFLSSMDSKNLLFSDVQAELLTFGFRQGENNYFHFNLSQKAGMQFGYPKDIFLLALKGNKYFADNTDTGAADFSSLRVNLMHYTELGLGYSRRIDNLLDFGVRVKLLFGHANLRLSSSDNFSFVTNPETFELGLYSDLTLNTSLPMTLGEFSIDDLFDDDNSNDNQSSMDDDFEFDPLDYMINFGNFGLAGDLGVIYDLDDMFSFALSVVDLGYISWKRNVESYNVTGEIEFDGLEIENLFAFGTIGDHIDDDNNDNDDDVVEDLLGNSSVTYSNNPYSFMLSPKIFLSAKYNISDIHSVSFLTRGIVVDRKLHPSFSLAYNIQPIRPLGFSLAYSVIHGTFNNIGLGMHLNLYPVQLYVVADNTFPAFQPVNTRIVTAHVGLNIVIGYRHQEQARPIHCWDL